MDAFVARLPVPELLRLRATNKAMKAIVDNELSIRFPGKTIKDIVKFNATYTVDITIDGRKYSVDDISYWFLQGILHSLRDKSEGKYYNIKIKSDTHGKTVNLKIQEDIAILDNYFIDADLITPNNINMDRINQYVSPPGRWFVVSQYEDMGQEIVWLPATLNKDQVIEYIQGITHVTTDGLLAYGRGVDVSVHLYEVSKNGLSVKFIGPI